MIAFVTLGTPATVRATSSAATLPGNAPQIEPAAAGVTVTAAIMSINTTITIRFISISL
jgi:hypothetical protein